MSRYGSLGVDVKKKGVEVFRPYVENLFPGAFCPVQLDPDYPEQGIVSHADGAGSKPIQSYLHWRETDDYYWFRGLAQDVVAMNLDDITCVGARPLSFIDYVTLNTIMLDRAGLLGALAEGFASCFKTLDKLGVRVSFAGGETADHPDQLRTLDVGGSIFGRVDLDRAVTGEKISTGDVIVGLRSGGRAAYEEGLNSGIMCNGLTLARSSLMSDEYLEKYPELGHPGRRRYFGRYRFDDVPDGLGMTVGEAVLSPTRLFTPVAVAILDRFGRLVHGIVHNTGGGLTKCLNLGRGIRYVKNSLPEPDPIFKLIQREGDVPWREMYEDFNMGVGFELIVDPEVVEDVIGVAERFKVGAQVVGLCERIGNENAVIIETTHGKFSYSKT